MKLKYETSIGFMQRIAKSSFIEDHGVVQTSRLRCVEILHEGIEAELSFSRAADPNSIGTPL